MPRYDYACSSCGHAAEEVHSIHLDSLTICPKCQKPDYSKQIAQVATDLREFHTPIEMYSIALNDDDEIKEFKRRAPDVDVATDPRDEMYGIPIARSRKQKLQALKAMEFTELN
jgi:putative FmdB family regulatory protein